MARRTMVMASSSPSVVPLIKNCHLKGQSRRVGNGIYRYSPDGRRHFIVGLDEGQKAWVVYETPPGVGECEPSESVSIYTTPTMADGKVLANLLCETVGR